MFDKEVADVTLPMEVRELYLLAKEAFITYEQLAERWDVNLLARFRDALDHIVMASVPGTNELNRVELLAKAREHLSEVVCEPFKNATLDQLRQADELARQLAKRKTPFANIPEIHTVIAELRRSSADKMIKARGLQGKIALDANREMFGLFRSAFEDAVRARGTLEALSWAPKWWMPEWTLRWIIPTLFTVLGVVLTILSLTCKSKTLP